MHNKGGMKKKMKKAIFLLMIFGLAAGLVCVGNAYAQEAAVPAETQEAYGEVVSVDANACVITITEYDYEKDEDVNKTYKIDKAATYENVKSLAEVKTGDWVALALKPQKDNTSLVTSVYVERYDLGEEIAPVETAPAAPAEPPAKSIEPPEGPQEEPAE